MSDRAPSTRERLATGSVGALRGGARVGRTFDKARYAKIRVGCIALIGEEQSLPSVGYENPSAMRKFYRCRHGDTSKIETLFHSATSTGYRGPRLAALTQVISAAPAGDRDCRSNDLRGGAVPGRGTRPQCRPWWLGQTERERPIAGLKTTTAKSPAPRRLSQGTATARIGASGRTVPFNPSVVSLQ